MTQAVPCPYSPTGIAAADADGRSCTCKPLRLTPAQKRVLPTIEPGGFIGNVRRETLRALVGLGLVERFTDPMDHAKGGPVVRVIGYRRTRFGDLIAARLPSPETKGPKQ